jgi:uncharacterized protein YbjT (DUF2867 family)
VRRESLDDRAKRERISALRQRGAWVVEGDLGSPATLRHATRGVDIVVSVVDGGADVVVDGQIALAEAAVASGAGRFLPSDFDLDLFKSPPGENPHYDARRRADEEVAQLGIESINLLCGVVMDGLVGAGRMIDPIAGVARYWGDGDEAFQATSLEDVARYAVKAALYPYGGGGKFPVVGQRLTTEHAIQTVERVRGRALRREQLGTVGDLRALIAEKRARGEDPAQWAGAARQLRMLSEDCALGRPRNDHYPEIRPESFAAFVERTLRGPEVFLTPRAA